MCLHRAQDSGMFRWSCYSVQESQSRHYKRPMSTYEKRIISCEVNGFGSLKHFLNILSCYQ